MVFRNIIFFLRKVFEKLSFVYGVVLMVIVVSLCWRDNVFLVKVVFFEGVNFFGDGFVFLLGNVIVFLLGIFLLEGNFFKILGVFESNRLFFLLWIFFLRGL